MCRLFSSASLSVFQQFVGINVVLYYATDIFKGMGMTTNASLLQTIIVGAVNLVFTVVAILTVDISDASRCKSSERLSWP